MNLKPLLRSLWREWIRPLALPVLLVTAAKSAFADINYVPTGSMKPTILEGDVVFINKLAYDLRVPFTTLRLAHWSEPARGDVVVCFAPDDGIRLVKRVIGQPGDTVELRHDTLLLNGKPVAYTPLPDIATASGVRDLEPAERRAAQFARESLPAGSGPTAGASSSTRSHFVMALPARPALRDFGPVTVPAGQYFMMGDNRDNSRDSRYFGFVERKEIMGQAKGIFLSGDLNHWLKPRFDRFFTKLE